jgi:hypothetical protein
MPPTVSSPSWPVPKFILRVDDLNHPGVQVFLDNVNPGNTLQDAVIATFTWLYDQGSVPTT